MKKLTEKEFDSIKRDALGVKNIPPYTDLTDIKIFGESCSFGEDCSFGQSSRFGQHCSFGKYCNFSRFCKFGKYCTLGEDCDFGQYCVFGESCSFEESCSFGQHSDFGKSCSFEEYCSFGEDCSFGQSCFLANLKIINYKAVDRVGKERRKVTCWNLEGTLYFQAGCFFDKEKPLKAKVLEKYGEKCEYLEAIKYLKRVIKKY